MKATQRFFCNLKSSLKSIGMAVCNKPPVKTIDKSIEHSIDDGIDETEKKVRDPVKANPLDQQLRKVVTVIDDAAITTKVNAAIAAEPSLNDERIHVDTLKGVSLLRGKVASQQNRYLAAVVASAVPGVKKVNNELQIALTAH